MQERGMTRGLAAKGGLSSQSHLVSHVMEER